MRIIAVAVIVITASGCMTLYGGTMQRVRVTSTPPGAHVLLNGTPVGVAPVDVTVSRRDPVPVIAVEKDGYPTYRRRLRRSDTGSSNAPAVASSPLTLNGVQLPGAVEIYRVAEPVVVPVVDTQRQPSARPKSKGLIFVGALTGAASGCSIGVYLNKTGGDADETTSACFILAGIGAGVGALVGVAAR